MQMLRKFYFYLTVFITGAIILVIEILGTRVISPFYGSTIFVWTSLISVTLGALALGYYIGGRIIDKKPTPLLLYFSIGVSGLFTLIIMKIDQLVLVRTDMLGLQYGPLAAAAILFTLPLLFLGMVTPMVIRLIISDTKNSGTGSGNIFSIATIGSICGGILTGFYLISLFSMEQIFSGIGTILILLAVIGLIISGGKNNKLIIVALITIMFAAYGLPKYKVESKKVFNITYQTQSYSGDIKVVEFPGAQYGHCLYVEGAGQTCVDENGATDGFFVRFLRAYLDSNKITKDTRVLIFGLGGGGIVPLFKDGAQVDIVEIDSKILEITTERFGFKEGDNIKVHIDDARHFMASKKDTKYDLIIENVSLGNFVPSYIFTKEAWSQMKSLLNDDGVILAHVASNEIDGDNTFNETVYSTVSEVFKYNVPLSSQENQIANFTLYLSDKPVNFEIKGEPHLAKLQINDELVVSDSRNFLEGEYLSNALYYRENTKTLGYDIFFVR